MVPPNNLGPDLNCKAINKTQYRGMIGSLIYLTASRPDIKFLTCLCARYQENPKESHLIAVKRIFRYLKGTQTLTLLDATWIGKAPQGQKNSQKELSSSYVKVADESDHSMLRFISLLLKHMAPNYDNEKPTINPTQIFSVHNWILKPNQPEEPPFTDHMKSICNLDVHVDSKAPKYSSIIEYVPQGKKPGARSGLRRKQSSKHTSESTTEISESQSGHSKKETKSSSAMDISLSHPSPPTLVVGEMHKKAQQAAGGPTSLGATSEEGAHPQLSSDFTAKADPGISTSKDSIS
ncbi:hypothetical protein Tco_0940961 [Tanacetum coccineum]|uniref:Retrovirus-related Pol polyprotein from transposon TNT 1-94 n=1 Tax=Tanacetum coccineum TaxID=301880 RepID=A0ABQ5DPH1_9ASTR